ncbi:MAG TPA: putative Ig domain-containing protein [Dokdonella sp.]|uniref:putative Ig domain-containing protein n=1 Tax=Dokdonella sp. TaxID=2291710 RepID=UPI002B55E423|nr:putative Ig domain-containing protein [Dokdonella sp.]HUD40443.1 putative Ig domain-containing protein [Dokdonella sp.]
MNHSILRSAMLALLATAAFGASAAPCPITTIAPAEALPDATVGANYAQPFTAQSDTGLPFAFSITSGLPPGSGLGLTATGTASAELAGTPSQVGQYVLTVTATDASGCSGGRTYALDVVQGTQTIAFTSTAPVDATIGGAPYLASASATSGLPVALSIDPAASAVCTLTGSGVTFQGAGTCVINADQPGDANYAPAPQVQQSFAVGLASQTITFTSTAPDDAAVGGPSYTVSASASSGLPVALSIDPSADTVCAVAGSVVSFHGAGTCVINADQPGDATHAPAPQAQQSFAVAQGAQTIVFTSTAPADAVVGGPAYAASASASSGLPVTLSIDPSAGTVCTIAGSVVSFHGSGTCVINADQPGDADYAPAPQVQQSFAVGLTSQTITFTSTVPAGAAVGGPSYTVSASASSGLPVALSIDPAAGAVCAIAGSVVSFHGAGTCVINANQPGDATYAPAPQVQQSFAVGPGAQTIVFTSAAPPGAAVGGPSYTVSASASSGLPVALSIDPAAGAVCSIAGSVVSFQGAGTCLINANQPGNAHYLPAPQVQQGFAVGPGAQTITFTTPAPTAAAVAGAPYAVAASATSGLPVTLSIDAAAAAVCSISGTTVSFQGAGTCIVNADQAGSPDWNPAPRAQQSFAVARGSQTIVFTSAAPTAAVVAGATYAVAASATSGLPVTFAIDAAAAAVCSISGTTVSFQGAGTCIVNADQAGSPDWNPAPQVQQSFAVGQGAQTISFTSTPPSGAFVGAATYTVTATASSGLPVAFSIDASAAAVCTISGAAVSFIGAGTCVVNANQAGDANWSPAPQVQQSFGVLACIALDVGEVRHLAAGAVPCVFNASGTDAEYTFLPINFGDTGEVTLSLTGSGVDPVTGPPTPRPANEGLKLAPLHAADVSDAHGDVPPMALPLGRPPQPSDLIEPLRGSVTPLVPGQLVDINAAVGGCTAAPDMRKGRVEAVTTQQWPGQPLLYAVQEVVETTPGAGDWHPPVIGGYALADFRAIIDAFVMEPPGDTSAASGTLGALPRTGAMGLARDNLGLVTDIDANGGVILFYTPKMNELSPPASSSVVQGMFQPRDMFSTASCPSSNESEILYLMVPDPTGSVNSNVRTLSSTFGNAVPTLVHHFTHLSSGWRRIYLNGGAPLEEMWLDEAIAWQMQELLFFNISVGLAPRTNVALANLTTGPNASRRVAAFNTYQNAMYGHDRTWFYQLNGTNGNRRVGPLLRHPASTGTSPTVHENAAQNFSPTYTFLRYMLDRRNTGDAALLNALVNSNATGLANLQAVFGASPRDWARDFLVAVYADDAVAGVQPEYSLPTWNYRSVYTGLSGYPLVTNQLTDDTPLTFTLRPGGGTRYARFGVAAGESASLTLTEGGATPNENVVTSILRTK